MCTCASQCDMFFFFFFFFFFFDFYISTVTQQKAFIFGACVHRRVFCDSIRMDPEFKPRDGASGQNL